MIENEIDKQNIELANKHPELLQRREREAKYVPTDPELFEKFKDIAAPIEQIYLSHPDEPFSLRVRAKYGANGAVSYTATLKDEGQVVEGKLDRTEIEVKDLPKAVYDFYANQPQFPSVKKLRAEPFPGVTVDFIEGLEAPLIEIEDGNTDDADLFLITYADFMKNRSDDKTLHNESIAHALHPNETLKPRQETNDQFVDRVVSDMVATYAVGQNQVVVGLSGMSGSGKSTMTRLIKEKLVREFGDEFPEPIVLSTDDYHFGKKALEARYGAPYSEWDAHKTYNVALLAEDLKKLALGEPLRRRHFDFATEEPAEDELVAPSPFVIVEGLYAGSPDLAKVRNLHYDMPVGIATSIGRDVRRLMIENRANRAFPTPEDRLRYQLEVALPLYLSQERPQRNSFSAHSRPLAQRAFLLERLRAIASS